MRPQFSIKATPINVLESCVCLRSPKLRAAAHEEGAVGFFHRPVDTHALIETAKWVINAAQAAPDL